MVRKLTEQELKDWQEALKAGVRSQALEFKEKKSLKSKITATIYQAKIDLHGLTLEKAHKKFLEFIYFACVDNLKNVLVITGKGSATGGKIRAELPHWANADYMNGIISSCLPAPKNLGGDGAFIIKLKRQSL